MVGFIFMTLIGIFFCIYFMLIQYYVLLVEIIFFVILIILNILGKALSLFRIAFWIFLMLAIPKLLKTAMKR
jgi:hypothetical protein